MNRRPSKLRKNDISPGYYGAKDIDGGRVLSFATHIPAPRKSLLLRLRPHKYPRTKELRLHPPDRAPRLRSDVGRNRFDNLNQ